MFAWLPAALLGMAAWGAEEAHTVPYVPSAAAEGHAGVVRIESRSSRLGEVRVVAVDDAGQRVEAGRLTLGAGAAAEFEIAAMESGNAALGLTGTGPGEGDWRLELSTELDIEARAYARSEGFLTALHDAVLLSGDVELPFFNPGGDPRRSVLRLANARGEPAAVSVRGVDDAGRAGGPVTAELGPWEARSYAASELESGSAAGLTGSLGDGDGGWRLTLSADRGSAYATNLLLDGSGVLSSVPGGVSRGGFHRVPLFPSASDGEGRRGLVRAVNRSADSAEVGIDAFDATDRAYERLELTLAGEASGQFDSSDLEQGNAEEGLEGSTGPGQGDWWLELSSASDIELLSYVDTASGPLSALRGTSGVETESGMRYEALLWGESGEVRLLNAGGEPAEVRLSGTDDAGSSGGAVELTLAPWSARTLTATALAEGEAGLRGALGAGTGSWRLRLEADRELDVLSLVRGSGGMLSDVSRRGRPAGAPPRTEVIDATARGRPDLWVAASASEAELSPGEAFELTAAVGNRGGSGAPPTTLRYHRSADASITAADAEVGTDAVAALAAGATSAESLTLNAPTAAGTYYYGACADAVAEETNTANNCSAAVAVTVREPPRQPDLAVAATPSDAALDPGESFTLSATVRNRGGADARATTLRYHRSTDATITTSDTEEGTDAVAELAASGSSAESIALTAPPTSGTYYYGACVDAVPDEHDTTNNCSAGRPVTVSEPGASNAPDLVVSVSVDNDTPDAGGEFDLTATVRNVGDGASSSTTLRYYRSSDATITTADTEQGIDAMHALSASQSSRASLTLNAPEDPGTYYYGACADAVPDESDTTDNCSAGLPVTVSEPVLDPPDLVVSVSVDNDTPDAGGEFELTATVRNVGDGASASTTLRYYRSSDATITTADTEQGIDAMHALSASQSSRASLTLNAPEDPGTYYYGACADAVPDESDTTDNCSAGLPVTVSEPVLDPPDLVVSVSVDNDTPDAGGEFELTATVRNVGDGASASTTLRYYRSRDAIVSPSDIVVGVGPVDALDASGMSTGSIARKAPTTAGTEYYGACVEAARNESDRTNNCSAAVAVTPQRLGPPDLVVVVSAGSDLSELAPGQSPDLDATVTNVGDGPSARTTLRYYWSTDGMIAPSDTELATDAVLALPATGRSNQSAAVTAPSEPGAYYFGACVDAVPDESDTTNNCSPALAATVRPPGPPDLHLSFPTSWCGTHAQGSKAFLSVAVLNYGESTSAPSTMRFYLHSGDTSAKWQVATRTVASAPPAFQEYVLQNFYVSVDVPNTPGRYGLVACVDVVEGETETTNNCAENSAFEVVQYDPLDDLDLTIPEGCPLEAEICLSVVQRGHWNVHTRHEKGLVRFNLNGSATLSTDKRYDRVCATVPVNAGSNSMQVDVVPGSGDQKLCPPSGSLAVRGNGAASSGWYVPLDSSTTSTLNVSLGDAGTCPAKD